LEATIEPNLSLKKSDVTPKNVQLKSEKDNNAPSLKQENNKVTVEKNQKKTNRPVLMVMGENELVVYNKLTNDLKKAIQDKEKDRINFLYDSATPPYKILYKTLHKTFQFFLALDEIIKCENIGADKIDYCSSCLSEKTQNTKFGFETIEKALEERFSLAILKILVNSKADLKEARDSSESVKFKVKIPDGTVVFMKRNILYAHCSDRSADEIKLLVDHGAQMDFQDSSGDTPLHIAISYGHAETALGLINAGASLDIKNYRGETPYAAAMRASKSYTFDSNRLKKVIDLLKQKRAPDSIPNGWECVCMGKDKKGISLYRWQFSSPTNAFRQLTADELEKEFKMEEKPSEEKDSDVSTANVFSGFLAGIFSNPLKPASEETIMSEIPVLEVTPDSTKKDTLKKVGAGDVD